MSPSNLVALAWCDFQPRTRALAAELGGEAHFIRGRRLRHLIFLPLRYLRDALQTWKLLHQRDPQVVLAITTPVFVPLVASLWCATHRRTLLMDCHTDAFHSGKWRWALPLHRWLARRARVVLLHTEEDTAIVQAWGARGLLLPDDLPEPPQPSPRHDGGTPWVVVAGSLDSNEPVAAALEAASLLPDVEVRFTGDPRNIPVALRSLAPANVVFTGWLDYPSFLRELQAGHVVAVFSSDPHIMNRAAFEAIGCGRPLVLSDLPGLRARFKDAALFCPNQPAMMAQTLRTALRDRALLAERSVRAQAKLRAQREAALTQLRSLLQDAARPPLGRPSGPRVLMVSPQHPYPFDPLVSRNVAHLLAKGVRVDLISRVGSDVPSQGSSEHPSLRVYPIRMKHRRTPPFWYALEYAALFLLALPRVCVLALLRRYDAVQVDHPPDFLVFAAWLPRLLGTRVVFYMQELLPEMAADRLGLPEGHWLIRCLGWLERMATGWADGVITVSEPCRRILVARGVPVEKISILPNTQPAGPVPARIPPRSPVLITHGTLLERYGVQIAIQAMAELQADWPELTLLVLGEGEYRSKLVELAARLRVSRQVIFRGFVPGSEATEEIRRATLGIVPVMGYGYGRLLSPTKLFAYVQQVIPVVCSRTPTIEENFPPDTLAYFTPGDARGLAAQVDWLLRHPERAQEQAGRASEALRHRLSWERVSPRYLDALGIGERPVQVHG